MKKNSFLTFCFSLVPGFGQMYQGYMRRGVSLAFWFWGAVFLAALLGVGLLGLFLPVIWAYSFFDTFNIRALTDEQRAVFRDEYIPTTGWLRDQKMPGFIRKGNGPRVAGWALVVFGIVILYNNFFSRFFWQLRDYYPVLATLLDALPQLVIAIAVIAVGVWMLRKKASPPPNDDFTQYGGNEHHE